MLTIILTVFALFAFALGYYIGKMSVLKETTEAFKDFDDKITFDPKKRK